MAHPLAKLPPALILLLVAALALRAGEDKDPLPFPDMAPTVGALLEHDYYDRSRFKPRILVERALRVLEGADIRVDSDWLEGVILINIAGTISRVPAPEPTSLAESMRLLEQVRAVLSAAPAFSAKESRDLTYAMLNGALLSLDPHTIIMPPEPANEFAEEIQGEFYGIGAFLNQEEGVISIERVMPGLPAERGGIEDGDIILGIDGEKTVGLSLDQAVRRIKGPKNTAVVLTVERKGVPKPLDISITRDLVQVITIRSHRAGDVGYVRMDEFNANTARDLYQVILDLQNAGPLQGMVLDLRYNGGGLLEQARIISDFFLTKNLEIVRTRTMDGEPQIFKSSSRLLLDVPMVVLTSGGSASAAEILAGALQRNDRAVVAGNTTFGKGSVQSIRPLRDNSRLKLTIQEYQLPGGVSIQDVGVIPDLRLVRHMLRKDGSVDLVPFSGSREIDDEFAIAANNSYQHIASYQLGWLGKTLTKEETRKSAISSRDFQPDQEARLAIDLLSAAVAAPGAAASIEAARQAGTLRQATLELLETPVALRAEAEAEALSQALAAHQPGRIWGAAAEPPAKALSLSFAGPGTVAAGEDAALSFAVANTSPIAVGRLYGLVRADKSSPFWEDEVVFGEVPANGTVGAQLTVQVPPRLYAGEERFVIDLYRDGDHEVLATLPVRLAVEGTPRPHFSYRWKVSEPGADGLVPGEDAQLELTLKNDGDGVSRPIDLFVFKDNDPYVQLGGGRFKLEALAAGAEVSVTVPFKVLPELKKAGKPVPFAGAAIKLQLNAEEHFEDEVDARYRANLFHKLTIPLRQPGLGKGVAQVRLELAGMEALADNQVRLSVRVHDDNPTFVALFQDEGKVDLRTAAALEADGLYRATVTLKPGLNPLRVVATDGDDVTEILPLRVWGPEVAAAAPPAKPLVTQKAPAPAAPEAVVP